MIQQEQIHQYFSQLGVEEGHNLVIGGGSTGKGDQNNQAATANDEGPLGSSTHQDASHTDPASLSESLKLFFPPERSPEFLTAATSETLLERFVTLGSCNDPSYMSRPALKDANYYADMGSADTRNRQAQLSAERAYREGLARKGSSHGRTGIRTLN